MDKDRINSLSEDESATIADSIRMTASHTFDSADAGTSSIMDPNQVEEEPLEFDYSSEDDFGNIKENVEDTSSLKVEHDGEIENNPGRFVIDTSLHSSNDKEDSNSKNEEKADSKNSIGKEIVEWIKTISIGALIGVLLVVFVIQRDDVFGPSMEPTLYEGNVIFSEKISTYFESYKRGDIVVLNGQGMTGYDREEYLVKRIIGLPGDTIRIADGVVYIMPSGQTEFFILVEDYLATNTSTTMMSYGVEQGYDEITLGENEYYCLGDNRAVSNDSRLLGPFTEDRIKGVAVVLVYPFNSFTWL